MIQYKRAALCICLFLTLLFPYTECILAKNAEKTQYWPQGPEIASASGIVIEAGTGAVLYEKNVNDRHYPASITKILTALLAIENSKMDEIVTFSYDSVHKTEGSGIARDVDEQMTMEQCLYGLMLASANECAYAVAEHVAGDIDSFVKMMNKRAKKLGCKNTHFNNCNGLPDEQHYTSAYDMALIAREAYQNETFRIICGTKTYTIPFTNKHTDEETYLQNHHQMLYPYRTRKYLYDYCLGGKTGYTTAANYTLVTYAEKDGMTLICVVMNAPPNSNYEDTRGLFDFCFDNFKILNVAEYETSYAPKSQENERSFGSYKPFVEVDSSGSVILPVTAEFKDMDSKVSYDGASQDILGNIQYTYAGRLVGGADIKATEANIEAFQFQEKPDKKETEKKTEKETKTDEKDNIFDINAQFIVIVACVALLVGAFVFLTWKLADNFYNIKRKLNLSRRDRSPYKTIKINKMYRKRRKKGF